MTIALAVLALLLPCLILAAWLFDAQHRDRQIAALRADMASERKQWTDERRELLNRIKPETAQASPSEGALFAPPAIPLEDDTAFFEDKEAMADRIAQAEQQLRELSTGAV